MITKVLRTPVDTWVTEVDPDQAKVFSDYLRTNGNGAGGKRQAYIFFPNLMLNNHFTVSSAKLYLYCEDAMAGGPHTFKIQLVTQRWVAQRTTFNNKPTTTATHETTTAVTGAAAGDEVQFNVKDMLNDVANGDPYFGFALTVNTDGNKDFCSAQSVKAGKKPRLEVTYYWTPQAPTDLRPAGGFAVASQQPNLAWSSEIHQAAFQVQISTDPVAFVANIIHDSTTVSSTRQGYSLVSAGYSLPANGDTRYWRVRVQNAEGAWSDYSDVVATHYLSPGTLTIVNPTSGGVVQEVTPPIDWTFAGRTQAAYMVTLYDKGLVSDSALAVGWGDDWGKRWGGYGYGEVWSSGWVKGTVTRLTLPPYHIKRLDSSFYMVEVRVRDTEQRTGSPGTPPYVVAQSFFGFQEVHTVDPVDSLSVSNPEGWYVQLDWTDDVQPDYYGFKVDGEYVLHRETPSKYLTSPGHYRKKFYHSRPLRSSEYEVVRIVKSTGVYKHSHHDDSPHPSYRFIPKGVWLVDELDDRAVNVGKGGDDVQLALGIGEADTVYYPIGRRDVVRVVDAVRGLEGSVTGQIRSLADKEMFESFKAELPTKRFRLITEDLSIRVILGEVSDLHARGNPLHDNDPKNKLWAVNFQVFQVDDWTFRARY